MIVSAARVASRYRVAVKVKFDPNVSAYRKPFNGDPEDLVGEVIWYGDPKQPYKVLGLEKDPDEPFSAHIIQPARGGAKKRVYDLFVALTMPNLNMRVELWRPYDWEAVKRAGYELLFSRYVNRGKIDPHSRSVQSRSYGREAERRGWVKSHPHNTWTLTPEGIRILLTKPGTRL